MERTQRQYPAFPKPGQVTGVDVTPGSGALTVTWTALTGVDDYKVQWALATDVDAEYDWSTNQDLATGTSHTIANLDPGTQYMVRVIATTEPADNLNDPEVHDGESSEEVPGTTAPGQVVNVSVVPGVEQLTVSWEAAQGATGYKVQWKSEDETFDDAETADPKREVSGSDITGTSHTIQDLTADTEYTVRVIAYNASGDGAPSEEKKDTPKELQPGQVANVTVTPGAGELMVSWDPVVEGATGYTVQWKSETDADYDATSRQASGSDITGESYTIQDLTAGTEYTVRVKASLTSGDDGDYSDEAFETPLERPAQVADVVVTAGPEQLMVSWMAAQGATGYKVQWKSGEETFDDAATADPKREASGPDITGTSYTIEDLTAGTQYTVQVIATGALVGGAPSTGDPSTEVLGTPTPRMVVDVRVSQGTGRLTVSWPEVPGATGYKVEWKSGNQAFATDRERLVATTRHVITGLTPGTEYTVRVTATLNGVEGPASELAMGTPTRATVTPRPDPQPQPPRQPQPPTQPQPQPPAAKPPAVLTPPIVNHVSLNAVDGGLQVRWLSLAKAGYKGPVTGYKVQWKSGSESYASDREDTATGPLTWIFHTIADLSHETEYTVRVLAFNEHGDGPASEELTGTPKQALPSNWIAGALRGLTSNTAQKYKGKIEFGVSL